MPWGADFSVTLFRNLRDEHLSDETFFIKLGRCKGPYVKSTTEERFPLPVNLLTFKLPRGTYERTLGLIKQLYGGGLIDRLRK